MRVLITDHVQADTDLEAALLSEHGVEFDIAQCRTPEQVIEAGRHADAMFVQYAPITRDVIETLPKLRLITINAVGVDSIDLDAAREHGVWVCNVPDASINEVASHALAMALSLVRNLPAYDRQVRSGGWQPDAAAALRRPSRLTLGILGLGTIGRELARLGAPCFKDIVAADPYLPADRWPPGITSVSIDDLFGACDVMSLHLPLLPETEGIVNHARLGRMRPGSYLINVSRGALVDIPALLAHLDDAHLAGAALDVLPVEPPPADDPVLTHPKVLLSPHAAYYSIDSEEDLRRRAIENILTWIDTGTPTNAVVPGR